MPVQDQIETYIAGQSEAKRGDMRTLHLALLQLMPECRLWFLDGKDSDGRTVANPNIGYGFQTLKYTDGTPRDFYQIGVSANTAGLSVYIIGLEDKTYLSRPYGPTLGKARVSGYCIKFKGLKDIDLDTLRTAIRDGVQATTENGSPD